MAINRVMKGSTTLIDVTDVGTTAETVAEGVTFIGNDGVKGVGAMVGGGGTTVGELLSNGGTLKNYEGSEVDLTGIDTSSRQYFDEMFANCFNLTSIDTSLIDTASAFQLNSMFYGDYSLTGTLDLSGFDTSNVHTITSICSGCNSLTSIDVTGWDTSNVTSMELAFDNCTGLTSLDVSGFDTSNVEYFGNMFYGDSNLTSLDVSNWDTSNGTQMSNIFGATGLTSLDLSSFNTSRATTTYGMLGEMYSLTTLKLPARFNECEEDLGLDNASSLQTIYVPTPALSYYTDSSATPHSSYFTDRPDLVNKVVGYTPPTTTYTFVTTGGSAVSPITTADFLQSQSSTPDTQGYVLRGWYFDSGFTKKVTFPYLNTNANKTAITLYAKYGEPLPYDVAHAKNINDMADPSLAQQYTIDTTCQPVPDSSYPDNPKIYFQYTNGANSSNFQVNASNYQGNITCSLLNGSGNWIQDFDIWNAMFLDPNTTYYIAVGFAESIGTEATVDLGFTIWS